MCANLALETVEQPLCQHNQRKSERNTDMTTTNTQLTTQGLIFRLASVSEQPQTEAHTHTKLA